MVLTTTPATLFALVDTCERTEPKPRRWPTRWSPTAQLLDLLLNHDIEDWAAIDWATLEALYAETWEYPTMEEGDDEDDLNNSALDQAWTNAWHVVCATRSLVPYQRLPIVPILTHPFY